MEIFIEFRDIWTHKILRYLKGELCLSYIFTHAYFDNLMCFYSNTVDVQYYVFVS